MALTKVEADGINLADTFAFTGAVSGAGQLVSLANDTTGATTSALEIDLSTSTDYAYQMLVLRGFASSSAADMYMQLRKDSDDSYLTDSYLSIIGSHFQSSSGSSSSQNGLWNGSYFRMVHNNVSTDTTHQLNDMKITPSWGSVQTGDAIQTHCLSDATMNPSASDDEPYEC